MNKPDSAPCLAVHAGDGQTIVRFDNLDSLNESNSEPIGQQLTAVAEDASGTTLVLDFNPIRFVTSTALGKLVSLHKKVRTQGGRLVLTNVCEAIQEVLAITRLDTLFDVEPNDDLSLHSLPA